MRIIALCFMLLAFQDGSIPLFIDICQKFHHIFTSLIQDLNPKCVQVVFFLTLVKSSE